MKTKHYTPKHLKLEKHKIKGVIKYIENSGKKQYTSHNMMKKIEQCLLASSIGITSLLMNSLVTLQSTDSYDDNSHKQSVYEELQNSSIQEIINRRKNRKSDKIPEEAQDISEIQNNITTNIEEPKEEVDSIYEIENVYGGEFSASENGIRTEEEILYVVNQTNWSQEEKDHIKNNLMEGLLYIQKKYDMDILTALAILHHEGFCGLYHYKKYGHIRVANIQRRKEGEIGVIGYFEDGDKECLYATWFDAVVDFANYVRTSEALEGATTWYELEFHNGYEGIFNGASTEDKDTYNKLKEYAKLYHIKVEENSAEVSIYNIYQAVKDYTTDDIYQETETLKSIVQGENEQSQEDEKEIY